MFVMIPINQMRILKDFLYHKGETNERILLYVYIKFDKCALYHSIIIKSHIKRFGRLVFNSNTTYSCDFNGKMYG